MKRLSIVLMVGGIALVVLGMTACGSDSTDTVTDDVTGTVTDESTDTVTDDVTKTDTETVTTQEQTNGQDCPPGQIPVIATGGCAKENNPGKSGGGQGTGSNAGPNCPPGQIAVIATGKCVNE